MAEITSEEIAATKPDCRGAAALFAQAQNVAIGKTKLDILPAFVLAIMAGMLIATGAMMSPTTSAQGESIPAIAHAVCLEVM